MKYPMLLAAISLAFAPAVSASEIESQSPIVMGETFILPSDDLNTVREINVRLPASYKISPERSYPVLYVIDGGLEQDFLHIAGLAQHGSIYHIAALDALRRLYGLPHRTGARSDMTWLYTGDVPELSDFAKESIARDCTRENAVRTSFAEVNSDPDKWRGVCILPDSFRMDPATLGR